MDYAHAEYTLSDAEGEWRAWANGAVAQFQAITGRPEPPWPPRHPSLTPASPQWDDAAYSLTAFVAENYPYRDSYPDAGWARYSLMIESPGPRAIDRLLTAAFQEGALTQYRPGRRPFATLTVHDQRSLEFTLQKYHLPTPAAWQWWTTVTTPHKLADDDIPSPDPDCLICRSKHTPPQPNQSHH
ncbi:hypothetical protein [Williamsia sp. 1135]|uniref:hypothetical protein n=1 Tax=Williamsia sp. 1135 TaxID=1889262 RepID=UPI000A114F4D|nr:hypothetical protein [Williamsia sp. 1135]ORM35528.1 hypothetical protein BFL43_09420 [Williamsia sp. 1135]